MFIILRKKPLIFLHYYHHAAVLIYTVHSGKVLMTIICFRQITKTFLGAEHTAAGELVHALVKLYDDNAATLTPDPLHSLFYDSHPPAALRILRLQGVQT